MGTWVNLSIAMLLLVPSLIFIALYKLARPRYYGVLLFAVGLILWAAVEAGALNESLGHLAEQAKKQTDPTQMSRYRQAMLELSVWLYIIPVVTAAVGANLITHFILSSKPANIETKSN